MIQLKFVRWLGYNPLYSSAQRKTSIFRCDVYPLAMIKTWINMALENPTHMVFSMGAMDDQRASVGSSQLGPSHAMPMAPLSHLVTGHWRWYLENSAAKMRSSRNMLNNIDWVDNSTVPKNKKGLGHISICYPFSICCPSFFLAHAQFPRAKTLAADRQIHWQECVSKCCCVQVATQFKLDALMTFTP